MTTTDSYKTGIAYAVKHLSEVAPHAAIYIDAAHGGWMGYETNAAKFADVVISMGNPTPPLPHPYPTPTPPLPRPSPTPHPPLTHPSPTPHQPLTHPSPTPNPPRTRP